MSAGLATASESTVVALACAGDPLAFDELARRRHAGIRRLLRRLCRNSALADDLAQEAFLQAWRQLHRLRSREAFAGWLRQIAVNAWLQHLRRSDAESLIDEGEQSFEHAHGDQIDLDRALTKLEPNERLCVVLAFGEGMSQSEIAAVTQLPLGTVKTLIGRATDYLRELLVAHDMRGANNEL